MSAITNSIEVARSPADVFAYIDQLDRHGEWQTGIVSAKVETEGPTRVGTRATEVRKTPGGQRRITYEITEHEPPRRFAWHGLDGPIRPFGAIAVEPVGDDRSRVSVELDFEGHGIGKLLLPLVRRTAQREVPEAGRRLKERLESGA